MPKGTLRAILPDCGLTTAQLATCSDPATTAPRSRPANAPSQVHLGPGPGVDDIHARSLRAALITGEVLEITDPGESDDFGVDWGDPRALTSFGEREPTEPWSWHGPARSVTGRTWGGCIEVIEWILTAGRFPFDPDVLDGGVLIIETSEELLPARNVGWIVRSLGERGILATVNAVLVASRGSTCYAWRRSR